MRLFFFEKNHEKLKPGTVFALIYTRRLIRFQYKTQGDQIRHEKRTQTPQTFKEISIRE